MTTIGMTCKVRLTYLPSNDGIFGAMVIKFRGIKLDNQ